jgi:hypothetical protein
MRGLIIAVFLLLVALLAVALLPPAASGEEPPGRFEILRANEDTLWRLDTASGEISACRFAEATLVCGSSEGGQVAPEVQRQLQREAERQRRTDELDFAERIFGLFQRFVLQVISASEQGDERVCT